ncbi:MAG: ACT domain-containing protein [Desulfomonilaceae bacterium]|nr:ACT domain-containing protein [Desulfomonilaceae bacterium]
MKLVEEISVQLENKPGTLSELSELLSADGISILALTVRTDAAVGTLSFVATDPARVVNVLESAGYNPTVRHIIAAEIPHHPGGINTVLKTLKSAGINVEYLYSCVGPHGAGDSIVIMLGVDDTAAAHDALSREWIRLHGEELYSF